MKPIPVASVDLSHANTLGVPATADWYYELTSAEDIPDLVRWARARNIPIRALGGGSNLVLSPKVRGLTLSVALKGIDQVGPGKGANTLRWRIGAGENWHNTVTYLIANGYSGVENLALIPGTAGAAPVQNIGAYGVELADCLYRVEAYDTDKDHWLSLSRDECLFGYRDSIFKQAENRYIITAVELDLNCQFKPQLAYGPLQSLAEHADLSAEMVLEKVIEIRRSRLPDPGKIPNAGSFFKNPVINAGRYRDLRARHQNLIAFEQANGWKLAAGWMIDQCGLRGKSNAAQVGCYEQQALVLVNPGFAGTEQILAWQHYVQRSVDQRFGVMLEPEPRFWE